MNGDHGRLATVVTANGDGQKSRPLVLSGPIVPW